MDLVLMSPPCPTWSLRGRTNFRSEAAADVDPAAARREWLALARGIEARGARVAVLAPDDALSGLPFAAEAGHPLPPTPGSKSRFLLSRMKPEHRRDEGKRWKPFLERIGFLVIEPDAGVWEGQGDVAEFDGTTLLFFGGRTDREGLESAKKHFAGELLTIELRGSAFHGNMAVLPLPHADCLLVCADVVEDDGVALLESRFGRDRMHFVSAEEMKSYATNGLPIDSCLLAPSCTPARVAKLVGEVGMKLEPLPMAELCEKAGGGSRCLVCVVRDATGLVVPEDARLAKWS